MTHNTFHGMGIEVSVSSNDDFLKVCETLTRMGLVSYKNKTLSQSCHLLHKRDKETNESRYAIMHFKEMMSLDSLPVRMMNEDYARRNNISSLLVAWGMVGKVQDYHVNVNKDKNFKVLHFSAKSEWTLIPKYTFGTRQTV